MASTRKKVNRRRRARGLEAQKTKLGKKPPVPEKSTGDENKGGKTQYHVGASNRFEKTRQFAIPRRNRRKEGQVDPLLFTGGHYVKGVGIRGTKQ